MAATPAGCLVVAGDIGGTNARLQLWRVPDKGGDAADAAREPELVCSKVYASRDFDGLAPLVTAFLGDAGTPGHEVAAAALAVCGPVVDNAMAGPKLPNQGPTGWGAKGSDLDDVLGGGGGRTQLLNDFIAVGLGLTALPAESLACLHPGRGRAADGVMACIGPGTGLGEVMCFWDGQQYRASPSEGGMTQLTATTEEEFALLTFLRERIGMGKVTVESVVSGPGLSYTFQFLRSRASAAGGEASRPVSRLPAEPEPAAVAAGALDGSDPLCVQALRLVMQVWARECRAVALRLMPTGGLFLGGGLTPKLLPIIRSELVPLYTGGDPLMGEFISDFPLYAVLDDNVGLLGARVQALRMLAQQCNK